MEQQPTTETTGIVGFMLALIVSIGIYVFICYCLKLICIKAGHDPGVLIWIPIVQAVPLLTVAKMPIWMIILLLIPFVNLVVAIIMWFKISEARGKPGWIALLLLVPIANILVIPYLAFSE